jgi:hypothetical protein
MRPRSTRRASISTCTTASRRPTRTTARSGRPPRRAAAPVTNHNPSTSAARPDIEWTIVSFNQLLRKAGAPQIDPSGVRPWSIQLRAFAGSFQDDGVSARTIVPERRRRLCASTGRALSTDACGVCGGNGASCLRLRRRAERLARYDACDVCGGNGSTCRDCARRAQRPGALRRVRRVRRRRQLVRATAVACPTARSVYDVCDVCGGDGFSCFVREQCSDTFQDCGFTAGQIWDGTFNRTARLQGVSGGAFRLSIGGDAYAAVTAVADRNNGTGVPLATFCAL